MVEKTPPDPRNRGWPESQRGASLAVEQPCFDHRAERTAHPFVHRELKPALRASEEAVGQDGAALPAEQPFLADRKVAVLIAESRQPLRQGRVDERHAHLE